jgi:hypothetical protein
MIEDLLIWRFVAEHANCTKSQLEPGILDRDCVHHRARWTQLGNLDASRVTNAMMLLTSNSKQFRLSSSRGFPDRYQFAS